MLAGSLLPGRPQRRDRISRRVCHDNDGDPETYLGESETTALQRGVVKVKSTRDRLRRTRDGRYEVGVYIEKDEYADALHDDAQMSILAQA